jgi:hypothetical protein
MMAAASLKNHPQIHAPVSNFTILERRGAVKYENLFL